MTRPAKRRDSSSDMQTSQGRAPLGAVVQTAGRATPLRPARSRGAERRRAPLYRGYRIAGAGAIDDRPEPLSCSPRLVWRFAMEPRAVVREAGIDGGGEVGHRGVAAFGQFVVLD